MNDSKTYSVIPDAETLKRFFEGKLNSAETSAIADAIAGDELMREAFAELTNSDFSIVKNISSSVNLKISNLTGRPPFYMRWQTWLSVLIGILLVSGYLLINYSPEKDNQVAVNRESVATVPNENENNSPKENETAATITEPEGSKENTKVNSIDNTMTFNQASTHQSDMLKAFMADTADKKPNPANDVVTNDGPVADPNDQKQLVKTDETKTQNTVPKTYRIRLADAGIMITENLAEKESSPDGRQENFDPRNYKIGDPVTRKKSNSYKIEDMPYYRGGDDAFASYIKGKIAIKSYKTDKRNFSTVVEFIVNSKGKIEKVKLLNPIDPAIEKDIVSTLSSVSFNPGKKSGKKGSMYYMMMMVFE